MKSITLLSTRKYIAVEDSVTLYNFVNYIAEDFINIEYIEFKVPKKNFDLLLFTSKNSVESTLKNPAIKSLKTIPCICVGSKTEELLQANGFKVLASRNYAEELAIAIENQYINANILFLCGNKRRDVLPIFLKNKDVNYLEITVYKNKNTSHKIPHKLNAVMFYSPSCVMSFLEQNQLDSKTICFCIGTTTALTLERYPNKIILSQEPTIDSLTNTVKQWLDSIS